MTHLTAAIEENESFINVQKKASVGACFKTEIRGKSKDFRVQIHLKLAFHS